jgi:hypothetical protein
MVMATLLIRRFNLPMYISNKMTAAIRIGKNAAGGHRAAHLRLKLLTFIPIAVLVFCFRRFQEQPLACHLLQYHTNYCLVYQEDIPSYSYHDQC